MSKTRVFNASDIQIYQWPWWKTLQMRCVTYNPKCGRCGRTAKRRKRGGYTCPVHGGIFWPVTDREYEEATGNMVMSAEEWRFMRRTG